MKKKIILILFAFYTISCACNAQDIIYIFYGKTATLNVNLNIKFNKDDAFFLKKKSYKVCTVTDIEKLNISFQNFFNTGPYNMPVSWADEIQLNLNNNSIHYIKIELKKAGHSALFVELSDIEGKKELSKKLYKKSLPYEYPE